MGVRVRVVVRGYVTVDVDPEFRTGRRPLFRPMWTDFSRSTFVIYITWRFLRLYGSLEPKQFCLAL